MRQLLSAAECPYMIINVGHLEVYAAGAAIGRTSCHCDIFIITFPATVAQPSYVFSSYTACASGLFQIYKQGACVLISHSGPTIGS